MVLRSIGVVVVVVVVSGIRNRRYSRDTSSEPYRLHGVARCANFATTCDVYVCRQSNQHCTTLTWATDAALPKYCWCRRVGGRFGNNVVVIPFLDQAFQQLTGLLHAPVDQADRLLLLLLSMLLVKLLSPSPLFVSAGHE
jgi:hypothetical protein